MSVPGAARVHLLAWAWGAVAAAWLSVALAANFAVRTADTLLQGKAYKLDALVDLQLSKDALDALHKGVPLTILFELEVLKPRAYLWDETVLAAEQRYELSYQALVQRYQVRNRRTDQESDYPTLEHALSALGRITDVHVIDRSALEEGADYTVQLRVSLDLEALPVPLRLMGYVSDDWQLSSEWYTWPLH